MSELTKDLIQHALDQDYNKASEVYNNIMNDKMSDLLDQAKVALAGQMFNGEEPEDEEIEDDDFETTDELDDEGVDGGEAEEDFDIDEADIEAEISAQTEEEE